MHGSGFIGKFCGGRTETGLGTGFGGLVDVGNFIVAQYALPAASFSTYLKVFVRRVVTAGTS